MLKTCRFLIPAVFILSLQPALSRGEDYELEKIIISKAQPGQSFSVGPDVIQGASLNAPVEYLALLPVDLQSRSLHGGIQTDYSIRGTSFQQTLVMLSGQRINDPQTGHFNSDIPMTCEDIERIEVIPGAASSLYGPDAIGGAIDFRIKKPQASRAMLQLRYGTFDSWKGLLSLSQKAKKLGLRLSVENEASSGFTYDTDFKKFTTAFSSSLDLPQGTADIVFGYQDKIFGAYDFYTPGRGYPSKEWNRTLISSAGLDLDKDGLKIRPNILWRRHYDKFMLDKTQVKSKYVAYHRTDVFNPKIYLQKELRLLGRIGGGAEYGEELIRSTTLGNHIRNHGSAFVDDFLDINANLASSWSLRYDFYNGFNSIITGSAGLKQKFGRIAARLGFSRNMRVPSFTELYYNDPTTIGDSSLKCEKSLNFEGGLDYGLGALAASTVFFWRNEKDFIDWVKNSPAQVKWKAENLPQDEALGVEQKISFIIRKGLNLEGDYTYNNQKADDSGLIYKYGQNWSRHMVNSGLTWNSAFGRQNINFTYKKKPGRRGWFLLNAELSFGLNPKTQIFLSLNNILNVEYQEIVGIPQPGRWVEGGLNLQW